MTKTTQAGALLVGVLCALMTLHGCSQFRAPAVEVAAQELSNPFDVAVEAARNGDLSHIKTCVESDSRYVDAYDRAGRTLLHYAAQRGDKEVVAYLLQEGAYVLAEDEEGYTPLDVALQSVAPQEVIDLLRETTVLEASAY